jgi:hypothetical protein
MTQARRASASRRPCKRVLDWGLAMIHSTKGVSTNRYGKRYGDRAIFHHCRFLPDMVKNRPVIIRCGDLQGENTMKIRNFLVLALFVLALLLAACGPGVQGPLPGSQSESGSQTEAVEPPPRRLKMRALPRPPGGRFLRGVSLISPR